MTTRNGGKTYEVPVVTDRSLLASCTKPHDHSQDQLRASLLHRTVLLYRAHLMQVAGDVIWNANRRMDVAMEVPESDAAINGVLALLDSKTPATPEDLNRLKQMNESFEAAGRAAAARVVDEPLPSDWEQQADVLASEVFQCCNTIVLMHMMTLNGEKSLRLAELDELMLPTGMEPVARERVLACIRGQFEVTPAHVEQTLRSIRTSLPAGQALPLEVLEYLKLDSIAIE